MGPKNEIVKKQVEAYCLKHLNLDYKAICVKVCHDLIQADSEIFLRGKAEIWSAAVVWSVGSENFLGDKSFEPYATLSDVCGFFKVNASTIGQKARKIKDILNISLWNPDYRLPSSKLGEFLDSLVMTHDGLIVSADMFDDDDLDEDNQKEQAEVVEEEAFPEYYLLFFKPQKKVPRALYYQLEYQLKKFLEKDEVFITSGINETGAFKFLFFGWNDTLEKIMIYAEKTDFFISDIYFDDNAEALQSIEIR